MTDHQPSHLDRHQEERSERQRRKRDERRQADRRHPLNGNVPRGWLPYSNSKVHAMEQERFAVGGYGEPSLEITAWLPICGAGQARDHESWTTEQAPTSRHISCARCHQKLREGYLPRITTQE